MTKIIQPRISFIHNAAGGDYAIDKDGSMYLISGAVLIPVELEKKKKEKKNA